MFVSFADRATYYTFKISTISAIRYVDGTTNIIINFTSGKTEIFYFADAETASFTYHNNILRQLKGE